LPIGVGWLRIYCGLPLAAIRFINTFNKSLSEMAVVRDRYMIWEAAKINA
jgi:hypothetical protein